MGDEIGLTAIGKTKPNGQALRRGPRIRIGDLGYARVDREAQRDRHLVLEMQRLAHARRLRARNELAEQDDALGVGRSLRRFLAERRVERIDERFGSRGHRGLLLRAEVVAFTSMRFYICTGVAPVNPDSLASCSSSEFRHRTRIASPPSFDGAREYSGLYVF